eukprot:913052-Pyramimonas_sp.AAC.1
MMFAFSPFRFRCAFEASSKRGPRGPQHGPKSAQDRPKSAPTGPQDAIVMAPETGANQGPPSFDR